MKIDKDICKNERYISEVNIVVNVTISCDYDFSRRAVIPTIFGGLII